MTNKVLIVDDEEDVLKSTELLIELLGYHAITLSDPGQVLEVAEREQPGLILQDLKMKSLNLAGLVASLRSNPKTADIPLVFFSASTDLANTAAKFDAWGYLAKPFSEKELHQLLDRTFSPQSAPGPVSLKPSVQKDIRSIFHDYWNLLSALNSYVQVLAQSRDLSPGDKKVVDGLDELIMKLESKTDRLRAYLMSLVAEPLPATQRRTV